MDIQSQDESSRIMRENLSLPHLTDPLVVKFILSYLEFRDKKQAAKATGISTADGTALLSFPDVHRCIQKLTEASLDKFGFDAAEVVERVKELAFVDIADLFTPDGRIIENIQHISPAVRRAIKKFKFKSYFEPDVNGVPVYAGKIFEVELWDKPRSLELLGREKDTFKKTTVVTHDVSKNAAAVLLGSLERANERKAQLTAPEQPKDVTPVIDVTPMKQFTPPPGIKS